jgi:hypothetical protein
MANKKKRLRWAKVHRYWTEELQQTGVDFETGVLRVLFNEADLFYFILMDNIFQCCFSFNNKDISK